MDKYKFALADAEDAETVSSQSLDSDSTQDMARGEPDVYSPTPQKQGVGLAAEELMMEKHLLQQRLTDVETQLREKQDDVFFQSIQLKEKTAKLQEATSELQKEKDKYNLAMRQVDDLQKTCQAQYSQNLELQYFLKQHKSKEAKRLAAAPPSDGEKKFQRQKDTVMRMMARNKRLTATNQRLMEQLEQHEQHAMWLEDNRESTHGHLLHVIREKDEALKRQQLINSVNSQQYGRLGRAQSMHAAMTAARSEASWDLPKHRTVLTTTEDTYIDCKIKRSAFEEQLALLKSEIKPALKAHKETADKALASLWYIYTDKRTTFRPKEDFFKEVTQQMTKTKVFVADMLRRVNTVIKSFLKEEKEIKETWRLQNIPDNHVACEADFPPPPDPMVDELTREVRVLKQRLHTAREESAKREQKAQLAQDKAECSLKFLQKRFFELHQELYTALHQVYKHRYKWIARLPNPLRNIDKKGHPLDVQFNIHLDRVITKDIEYVKKFGEYMTSDETFGADMTAICEERERVKAEKKERVRRADSAANGDALQNRQRRHTAPTLPGPAERRGSAGDRDATRPTAPDEREWDMSRMNNWRAKQQQIWERRRSGMLHQERERTVYIGNQRYAPEDAPHTLHGINVNINARDDAGETAAASAPPTSKGPSPKDGAATRVHQAMREAVRRDSGISSTSPHNADIPPTIGLASVEISGVKVKTVGRAPSPPPPAAMEPHGVPMASVAFASPPPAAASVSAAAEAQAQPSQAPPQHNVPLTRASTEIFNRVILKRRNLPLRVARSEGKELFEGAYGNGYLLEGSKVARKTSLTAAA